MKKYFTNRYYLTSLLAMVIRRIIGIIFLPIALLIRVYRWVYDEESVELYQKQINKVVNLFKKES